MHDLNFNTNNSEKTTQPTETVTKQQALRPLTNWVGQLVPFRLLIQNAFKESPLCCLEVGQLVPF